MAPGQPQEAGGESWAVGKAPLPPPGREPGAPGSSPQPPARGPGAVGWSKVATGRRQVATGRPKVAIGARDDLAVRQPPAPPPAPAQEINLGVALGRKGPKKSPRSDPLPWAGTPPAEQVAQKSSPELSQDPVRGVPGVSPAAMPEAWLWGGPSSVLLRCRAPKGAGAEGSWRSGSAFPSPFFSSS